MGRPPPAVVVPMVTPRHLALVVTGFVVAGLGIGLGLRRPAPGLLAGIGVGLVVAGFLSRTP